MRHLIVLPGNNPHNRTWGKACAEQFAPQFFSVCLQCYDHWESDQPQMDMTAELEKLRKCQAELPLDAEVTIMAKSQGALLALRALEEEIVAPMNCIFFGLPLDLAAADGEKADWSLLQTLKVPTLAFHNDEDPTADHQFTKTTLAKFAPQVQFVTLHDATHDYLDFQQYERTIKQFLAH